MLVRSACFLLLLSTVTHAEGFRLFGPPKPKVVATPTPAPSGAAATKPGAAPATAANGAKPAPRKRPVAKPEDLVKSYMPKVKTAIALRWGETVTPLLKDFSAGNVSVAFKLDAEGKVTDFSITQNTSNEAFAKFCEQYVRETPFEKPPEKALVDGQVEIPFTFWIY